MNILCSCFSFTLYKKHHIKSKLHPQETFPSDPVITEALIHASGQLQGAALILMGNAIHWQPNSRIVEHEACFGVQPWDYTPFYYLIMAGAVLIAAGYIFLVNPRMRRAALEQGDRQQAEAGQENG